MNKQQVRAQAKALRNAVPPYVREAHSRRICEKILALLQETQAKTVMVYYPIGSEVDVRFLFEPLWQRGCTLLLPLTEEKQITPVLFYPGRALRLGAMKVPEPITKAAYHGSIDACVLPGLAFDTEGTRCGYGAGCYDRFFAQQDCLRIGAAFDCQILEYVPRDEHDVPADVVITPEKILQNSCKKMKKRLECR